MKKIERKKERNNKTNKRKKETNKQTNKRTKFGFIVYFLLFLEVIRLV